MWTFIWVALAIWLVPAALFGSLLTIVHKTRDEAGIGWDAFFSMLWWPLLALGWVLDKVL
jgi:hypothetical protein